jgi:hypothetical protein
MKEEVEEFLIQKFRWFQNLSLCVVKLVFELEQITVKHVKSSKGGRS